MCYYFLHETFSSDTFRILHPTSSAPSSCGQPIYAASWLGLLHSESQIFPFLGFSSADFLLRFEAMNRLLTANPEVTRPVIDKVFEFKDAVAAYAHLESQTHVGKIVIKVA
jgi:NADPH:quinone reductase-like Zn-dependent oxidoreductase